MVMMNLYKGGLSIRTPLNSYYQVEALKALREGLEEYDRKTWLARSNNKYKKKIGKKICQELIDPDKSLNWKLAKVIDVKN